MGIGGVALTWLLQKEGLLAKPIKPELASQAHSLPTRAVLLLWSFC